MWRRIDDMASLPLFRTHFSRKTFHVHFSFRFRLYWFFSIKKQPFSSVHAPHATRIPAQLRGLYRRFPAALSLQPHRPPHHREGAGVPGRKAQRHLPLRSELEFDVQILLASVSGWGDEATGRWTAVGHWQGLSHHDGAGLGHVDHEVDQWNGKGFSGDNFLLFWRQIYFPPPSQEWRTFNHILGMPFFSGIQEKFNGLGAVVECIGLDIAVGVDVAGAGVWATPLGGQEANRQRTNRALQLGRRGKHDQDRPVPTPTTGWTLKRLRIQCSSIQFIRIELNCAFLKKIFIIRIDRKHSAARKSRSCTVSADLHAQNTPFGEGKWALGLEFSSRWGFSFFFTGHFFHFFYSNFISNFEFLPLFSAANHLVFWYMSDSYDGIHMGNDSLRQTLQILLNYHCNRDMRHKDATCCVTPPPLHFMQIAVLSVFGVFVLIAVVLFLQRHGSMILRNLSMGWR